MGEPDDLGALAPLAGPARAAARSLASLGGGVKDAALRGCAGALEERAPEILEANAKDLEAAKAESVAGAIIDRLMLTEERIGQIADGLRQVVALKDPIGEILQAWTLPNGLEVEKVRVPLGVIGVIYEGRPNVTVDAGGLA